MARMAAKGLSEKDVVRYLRQQASLNKDKRWGNPALAQALERLATRLEGEIQVSTSVAQGEHELSLPDEQQLRTMELSDIAKLLDDERRTKAELIELAFVRFSIPRSRLQRMVLADIHDVLQAAVQHEASIAIIGREAERQGSDRRS